MAVYCNVTITKRIKIQDPQPDNVIEQIEEGTTVSFPFDVEEIDEGIDVTVEDAD